MRVNNAVFVSGLEIGTSTDDNIMVLGLIDTISNDEGESDGHITYKFILPESMIKKLSRHLNKVCGEMGIEIEE